MKRRGTILVCAMTAAGLVLWITARHMAGYHGRFRVNYGSDLLAVTSATDAVVAYHEATGNYPFCTNGLALLEDYGFEREAAPLVQLLETNVSSEELGTNTICVVSMRPTNGGTRGPLHYAGLLSGQVVPVPEADAKLGTRLR